MPWWLAACTPEPARPPHRPAPEPAPVFTTPQDPLVGSCEDLLYPTFPERPPRNARRASDVRTSWIVGTERQQLGGAISLRYGQLVAGVDGGDNGIAVFESPLGHRLGVTDAGGWLRPRNPQLLGDEFAETNITDHPGKELIAGPEMALVFEGSLPLRTVVAESVAVKQFDDSEVPAALRVTAGDWDGDGVPDLAFAWSGYVDENGVQERPSPPYPVGGLAVYRGPVGGGLDLLRDPPAATYDPTAPDLYAEGSAHSGQLGVLIGDQDGDGKADVVVDGYTWGPGVPDDPHSYGGIAFFSSGPRKRSELEHAELRLYGLCGSYVMDLQKVGDVTGDGLEDVVVIAHGGVGRGIVFVAPHLGDLTGHHPLTAASRAIIVHDATTVSGFAYAHFDQARGMPDLDGNGVGELVLTDSITGAAYVFLGPLAGVLNIGDADLTLEDGGQGFGYAVAVGDLDGDALPDLAVGDPDYADHFPDFLGAISVFPGSALLAALEPR